MRRSPRLLATVGLIGLGATLAAGSASVSSADVPDRVIVRASAPVNVPPTGPFSRQARAYCQRGETVISGGAEVTAIRGSTRIGEYLTFVTRSLPLPEPAAGRVPNGWLAGATNMSESIAHRPESSVLRAYAVCAS